MLLFRYSHNLAYTKFDERWIRHLPVTMPEKRLYLYLDCFTFGARLRRVFYAIILEGFFLLGVLSFTPEGLLDTSMLPQFTGVLTVVAVVLVVGTFLISRSAADDSFSPILHTQFVPDLIAAGYLTLGLLATGAGYLAHVLIFQTPLFLTLRELWIGFCIGLIFGFLILFYYDRYEIETPGDSHQFNEASEKMLEDYRFLEESELPPVKLTKRYQALEVSIRETVEILEESTTRDGVELARDMDQWVDEFSSKPEPAKDRIVANSEPPQQEELKDRRQEFKSVLKRVRRIANHG